MDYSLLASFSFVIGMVVGLTGIGGASLITPMLILVFQVPASVAISSDIVAAALMKGAGGWKHWQQETLEPSVVKWLALGSVPGSLAGVVLLRWLRQLDTFDLDALLLKLVGTLIFCAALIALVQLMLKAFWPKMPAPELPKIDLSTGQGRIQSMLIGAVLGSLVGITSVSSGSLFILVLVAFFQLDAQKLVGTDLAHAAILLAFTAVGHILLGAVDWHLVIPIWLGSVPGVVVGATLCQIAPQRILRFGIYLLLAGVSWQLV
jgi:uncharacterized protein